MATFKIKLEDKAAFESRLKAQNVALETYQIKDNRLKDYFEVNIVDPKQLEITKVILKQSPKINTIKEMKKFTKNELKEMIRQELSGAISEKKKMNGKEKIDENELNEVDMTVVDNILQGINKIVDPTTLGYLATVLGISGGAAALGRSLQKQQDKTGKSATPRTDRMTGYGR